MTPSDTTARRQTRPRRRADDVAALITACGRDERAALQALYKLTAPKLYGLALKAADDRAAADQALVQTYLAVFSEATGFERDRDDAMTWLLAMLSRELPGVAGFGKGSRVKHVQPPLELWQKLDIGLGLKRLDRHIKPGVATQARGRDPMPAAQDRLIERRLRFWRIAGVASFLGLVLAVATLLGRALGDGPGAGVSPPAAAPIAPPQPGAPSTAPAAAATAASLNGDAAWFAILRPAAGNRAWRVEGTGDALQVTAVPPFSLPPANATAEQGSAATADRVVLALWASTAKDQDLQPLGTIDPQTTTSLALPAGLDDRSLELAISLEVADRPAADGPSGPLLFAGGRAR